MANKKMINMRNYSAEAYQFVGEHIEAYAELIGFWRWYPDLMFDFLRPETNAMTLDIDQRVYLRGLVRSKGLYSIYNRGYGKCVTKDTLIYTSEGIKEIGSFFNYRSDGMETKYNNLDIEVVNRAGRPCKVTKGIYSGKKPCKKIKTREGYELSGTYVHPILTMNEQGALEYKCLADIKVGDIVCISRNNNLWGKENNKESPDTRTLLRNTRESAWNNLYQRLNSQKDKSGFLVTKEEIKPLQILLLNAGVVSAVREGAKGAYIVCPLPNLVDSQFYYTKVVSAEDDGVQDVYDLQVDDTHSFVSNGFISHNTLVEVMGGFSCCMLYPGLEYAVTAQTKENAASVVGEKVHEILSYYPAINNEIADLRLAKNSAEVLFKNGSRLNILANSQSSKGQRRKRLAIEESVLVDNFTFQDALAPIVDVPRRTRGKKSVVDPKELNGQINFLSTAGYKGTSEYSRFLDMIDEMLEIKGPMVLTADWKLSTWFGRGKTMDQIKSLKRTTPKNIFDQNYGSRWVGSVSGAIVSYGAMQKVRDFEDTCCVRPNDNREHEYYVGYDIARSENTGNNKSALSVIEVFRDERGIVNRANLVYLTLIPNYWTNRQQAIFAKKIYNNFKFRAIIVDGNGVGVGVMDELLMEQTEDGVTYPAWGVMNENRKTEVPGAPKLIYCMKAGLNTNPDIITNFANWFDTGKIHISKPITEEDLANFNTDNLFGDFLPKKETEELVAEIFNLKMVINGKSITIEKVDNKLDKDRYSSVAYVLWYVKNFAETLEVRTKMELTDSLRKAFEEVSQGQKKYTPFGNRMARNPFGNFRNPFGGR